MSDQVNLNSIHLRQSTILRAKQSPTLLAIRRRICPGLTTRHSTARLLIFFWERRHAQIARDPRQEYSPEDDRVRPYFYLSAQMPTGRIDPCLLRDIAGIHKLIDVGDGDLRV